MWRISIVLHGNCLRENCHFLRQCSEIPSGEGGRPIPLLMERPLSLGVGIPPPLGVGEATFAGGGTSGTKPTGKEDSLEFRGSVFPASLGFSTYFHPNLQDHISSHSVPSL